MTGMDVLRQCRRYSEDVQRLELRRQMAMDAATRITAGMGQGGGRSGDVSDKAGRYACTSLMIDQALEARKAMYNMELMCAGELFNRLSIDMAEVMNARMLMGLTVQKVARESDQLAAKRRMQASYQMRMILIILATVLAIIVPGISWVMAVISLFFPRLTILVMPLFRPDLRKKGGKD